MKKLIWVLLLLCLCIVPAQAEEVTVVKEGTSGNCPWVLTSDGVLRIGDADAEEQLVMRAQDTGYGWRLGTYGNLATSVIVEGEVWATECSNMFSEMSNLRTADLTGLRTDNVTTMAKMFYNCDALETLTWDPDTSSVTTMKAMFYSCPALCDLDSAHVREWDTSSVTDMKLMFFLCKSLTELDLSGWDTAAVTDMSEMFYHCEGLTRLDVSTWDTSAVTDMSFMFSRCRALPQLDVSGFDTTAVTDMNNMFRYCDVLESLDLGGWDTSKVEYMHYMFQYCPALRELDVSGWDTAACQRMDAMFNDCPSLLKLDLRSFSTAGLTEADIAVNTFHNCGASVILFTPELWDHPENPCSSKLHENALGYGGYTLYAPGEYRLYPLTVEAVDEGGVTISCGTLRSGNGAGRLVCAAYDEAGMLLEVRTLALSLDGTIYQQVFACDTTQIETVKVFLLSSVPAPMTPIGAWTRA